MIAACSATSVANGGITTSPAMNTPAASAFVSR